MIDDGLIIADLAGRKLPTGPNPFAFLDVASLGTDGHGDPRFARTHNVIK